MSVLQPWVEELPLMMQSTLVLGLRGPDTHAAPSVKALVRWLRGHTFRPGNPDNVAEFMGSDPPEIIEKGPAAKELEFCSQHFYSHLMHAFEVVAYEHPNDEIAKLALARFRAMAELMHLPPERRADFDWRLRDREWPGGKQPRTFGEAIEILADADRSALA